MTVTGYTIQELANMAGVPYKTAHKRLQRAEIEPLTKEDIYPLSAKEVVCNPGPVGRPRKAAAPEPKAKGKKAKK